MEVNFDHSVAVRDPKLFAARPPEYDQLGKLERRLRMTAGKHLIAGTIGNGKTSVLYELVARLAPDRRTIFVDLGRHFHDSVGDPEGINHIEPWELLGLLGLALYRAAEDRWGHQWGDEPKALGDALEQLRLADQGQASDSRPAIDIAKLAKGIAVLAGATGGSLVGGAIGSGVAEVGSTLVETTVDATRWTWLVGLPSNKRRLDQEPQVKAVLSAVNQLIRTLQAEYRGRLLLVVDGLDLIKSDDRIGILFGRSPLLLELGCDAVLTTPVLLLTNHAQRAEDRGFGVTELYNLPVLDQHHPGNPNKLGPGVAFFHDLTSKRLVAVRASCARLGIEAPADPLPATAVDRLAYYCGGVVRDFVRMVRLAALLARERDAEGIDGSIVDEVLQESRETRELRISREAIELLQGVKADPDHRLPGTELAAKLLDQKRLIPYPNNKQWYYPHPLLTLELL